MSSKRTTEIASKTTIHLPLITFILSLFSHLSVAIWLEWLAMSLDNDAKRKTISEKNDNNSNKGSKKRFHAGVTV